MLFITVCEIHAFFLRPKSKVGLEMFGFVFNICSTIVFYFKLFKRRLFTIIGLGHQPKSQDTSILPQRQNNSSLSSHGLQVEESWDSWTQDAKHELTSVSIGNQETFIEDRKIDNLFAEMAPQVQHHANVVPIKPRLEVLQSTSSFNSVSKFAFNDAYTTKVTPGLRFVA